VLPLEPKVTEKTKKKHISDKKHALHPSTALEEFREQKVNSR
jgi:hypothetical protein